MKTMLLREPTNERAGTGWPRCEFAAVFPGGECCNPGEDRYDGKPLCRPHAMLLGLECRAEIMLGSLSVLDSWLEDNAGGAKDEVRVQRIKHWRAEVMEQIDSTGLQLEAVREELE
jgi:hypothetical protein